MAQGFLRNVYQERIKNIEAEIDGVLRKSSPCQNFLALIKKSV